MIAMIETRTERSGRIEQERRFYLSSAKLDAKAFAAAVRSPWGTKNRPHWVARRRLSGRQSSPVAAVGARQQRESAHQI